MRGKFKYYKIVTAQQNVTKNAQDIKKARRGLGVARRASH